MTGDVVAEDVITLVQQPDENCDRSNRDTIIESREHESPLRRSISHLL